MKHTLYKRSLGKKLREFSPEEKRIYYKLRYHSHTPEQRKEHNKRGTAWAYKERTKSQAAAHNRTVLTRYPHLQETSDITNASLARWLDEHRGSPCTFCSEPNATHIDHIIPLARGGSHTFDNIQILCYTCNFSKRDMLADEFFTWVRKISSNLD